MRLSPRHSIIALFCLAPLAGCSASHVDCTGGDCPDGSVPVRDAGVTTADGTTPACLPHAPTLHRPMGSTCDHVRPPGTSPDPGGPPAECLTDTDCTMGMNGRCNGNSHDGWRCTYDVCFADADCGAPSMVCECEGSFRSDANACLPGNCRTDADCATGFCSPTLGSCGDYTGTVGWFCHTCADTCVDDADCGGGDAGLFARPYCAFDPMSGRWGCQSSHCVG